MAMVVIITVKRALGHIYQEKHIFKLGTVGMVVVMPKKGLRSN